MIKAITREFWFSAEKPGRELFTLSQATWTRAQPLVRAFYCALVFFACWNFDTSVERFDHVGLDPLWPLFWIKGVSLPIGIRAVLVLFVIGSLAAAWRPEKRAYRILAFLGVLESMALDNSFGKINNHLHLWTAVAFILIFLPSARTYRQPSPVSAAAAVRVFWGAQALILLTYTMSGIAKLLGAAVQLYRGDAHYLFSFDALARHISDRLLQTGERSLVGPWMIDHPYLSWPLLPAAVYLETFALWAAFRPTLHRTWGLSLIIMHIGIMLAMNITFSHSILLLALFFLASPFAMEKFSLEKWVGDLPLFGPFLVALRASGGFIRKDSETVLFYDGSCGLCSRWVTFVLRRRFPVDLRFATLQGEKYAALVTKHPALSTLDSLVVLRREGTEENVLIRSEAVFWLLARLPGWPRLTLPFNLIPMFFLDLGYRFVASIRHRLDQGRTVCAVVSEQHKHLFLESTEASNR